MLRYLKKIIEEFLSYSHSNVAYTIYNIADSQKLRENVKYNGKLDQFEIPVSELANIHRRIYEIDCTPKIIEGTSIFYYVDLNRKFCFGIVK